jgi:addiction module RelB/DinJ family antitoxin
MGENYEIRLYDESLLSFEMTSDSAFGLSVEIKQVSERKRLLPLGMELSNDGVLKWLERRVIPKNRTFVSEILQSLGLTHGDVKGIIDVCRGLSLNDSYWIVPQGFDKKFTDCNLYENRFSEILSLVAYTGMAQSDAAFTTSPELTTNGLLPKAWRLIEGDGIYLCKGGTAGFANSGREPYCEFYASQIQDILPLKTDVDAVTMDAMQLKICSYNVLINCKFSGMVYPRGEDTMSTIQFRTNETIKSQSNAIFRQLGITMSDAINMFLHQSILHGGLPFELKIPRYNETTLAALADMEQSKGKGIRGKSVGAALADLKADDGDDE